MKPRICNDQLKVIIPVDTEECEFWLSLVKSIDDVESPDRDHAWITTDNVFYIYNGKKFVAINDPNTLKVKWGNVIGDIADQKDLYDIISKTIWIVKENGNALDFDYVNHSVDVNVPIMTIKLNGNKLEPNNYEVNIDLSDYAIASSVPTKLSQLSNDTNYISQEQLNEQIKVKSISVNTEPQTADEFGNVELTVPTKTSQLTNDSTFVTDAEAEKKVKIKSISVNKEAQTIDDNGNVDLTISSGGTTKDNISINCCARERSSSDNPEENVLLFNGSSFSGLSFFGSENIRLAVRGNEPTKEIVIYGDYSNATTSKEGLMSATDKSKLDALPNFYSGTASEPTGTFVEGDIYFQTES